MVENCISLYGTIILRQKWTVMNVAQCGPWHGKDDGFSFLENRRTTKLRFSKVTVYLIEKLVENYTGT